MPEPPPDLPAWGVLMENGYPGGVATLTAFTGGSTSSFASDSDIVTNGDTYEHIRHANAKFIETANKLLEHFEPNEGCPLPRLGETVFHVRTDAGISYQFAETRDLLEDRHLLSPLYHAGDELLKHLHQLLVVEREKSLRARIAGLDEKIASKPHRADLLFERAELYSELEEFEKAVADHDKVVAIMPTSLTYIARGCLYTRMSDFKSALADFDRAIQADPKNAMAYTNRGAAYSKLGDVERAIADYGLAIKYQPKYPNSYANRAYAYYKLGEYEKGIADCDRAIALRPDHADTYSNRGLCRAAMGDKEGARADFLQALELAGTQSVVDEALNGLRSLEQTAE